jgi:hypothetical protein
MAKIPPDLATHISPGFLFGRRGTPVASVRQSHIPLLGLYGSSTGLHRFFFLFATRPHCLQMNLGLSTSGAISLMSSLHEQHVSSHNLSISQHSFFDFLPIHSPC